MNKKLARELEMAEKINAAFKKWDEQPCPECSAPLEAVVTATGVLALCLDCGLFIEDDLDNPNEAAVYY